METNKEKNEWKDEHGVSFRNVERIYHSSIYTITGIKSIHKTGEGWLDINFKGSKAEIEAKIIELVTSIKITNICFVVKSNKTMQVAYPDYSISELVYTKILISYNEDGKLSQVDLNENLYPEDKMKVSVNLEIPPSTVYSIANGSRSYKTEQGRKIVRELIPLALVNIQAKKIKEQILNTEKVSKSELAVVSDDDDFDVNHYRERNYDCGNDDL